MSDIFDAEKHCNAMQNTMGLNIEAAWKPGVLQHLRIAADMAARVNASPLDHDLALANVYIAGQMAAEDAAAPSHPLPHSRQP